MSLSRIRKPTLIVLSLLLALAAVSLAPQPAAPGAPVAAGNAIALKPPPFVQPAYAQEGTDTATAADAAAAPLGFPQDEAGISAYFKSASPVNLADVRGVYRVIEVETADYIIGSVPVPDYIESHDVHLYVHRDGWFLAYYLSQDPTGKTFDWTQYSSNSIKTKLERILAIATAASGVALQNATFYDFRYPNATHLMLVAEDLANGSDFTIKVPGTYAYYERSWSLASSTYYGYGAHGACWRLNDSSISCNPGGGWYYSAGTLTPAQFLPDTTHTVDFTCDRGTCYGGLALIYRVP